MEAISIDRVIAILAGKQQGVVARRQLLGSGVGRRSIDIRLRRGQLFRIHPGVYAVGHDHIGRRGRLMAAVLASGPMALLSHRTAAEEWGLIWKTSAVIEVTRPKGHRGVRGVRAHRSAVRDDERAEIEGVPVTGPARTQFDLASLIPRGSLERAMNQAEVLELTDRVSLPQLLDRYPGHRGNALLREILRDAERRRGVTANEFEEQFAGLIDRYGLPRPRFNADIAVDGRFIRADALWEGARLIAELDGRRVHGTVLAFESDRERDRKLLIDGWRVTRITWKKLNDEPAELATELRRLLDQPPRG